LRYYLLPKNDYTKIINSFFKVMSPCTLGLVGGGGESMSRSTLHRLSSVFEPQPLQTRGYNRGAYHIEGCMGPRAVQYTYRYIYIYIYINEGKVIPLQARCGPEGG